MDIKSLILCGIGCDNGFDWNHHQTMQETEWTCTG